MPSTKSVQKITDIVNATTGRSSKVYRAQGADTETPMYRVAFTQAGEPRHQYFTKSITRAMDAATRWTMIGVEA
jgi:hypothetical protein